MTATETLRLLLRHLCHDARWPGRSKHDCHELNCYKRARTPSPYDSIEVECRVLERVIAEIEAGDAEPVTP